MNRLFLPTIVFCMLCSGAATGQEINWLHDLEAAQKMAAAENKLILLHFSADWCRPCKQLESFVFTSSMVVRAINEKVIPVHIDTDDHPELVKKFSIEQIPTDVILTTKGRVVSKRKSPKDSTNYLRMVRSLPLSETANELQNAEMAEKIERVVQANKKKLFDPNTKDFVASKPTHKQPAPSQDSLKLAAKSQARQAGHQEESFVPRKRLQRTATSKAVGPQRVINDKFFVEKSAAATRDLKAAANEQTRSSDVEPNSQTPRRVASATISNPFHAAKPKGIDTEAAAARILTPDFGKEAPPVAKSVAPGGPAKSLANNTKVQQSVDKPNALPVQLTARPPGGVGTVATKANATMFTPRSSATLKPVAPKESAKKLIAAQPRTGIEPKQVLKPQTPAIQTASKEKEAKPDFALGGRCPVTLLRDGKWLKGDSQFGCVHRGRVYIFANEAKLRLFKTSPDTYSPILAGFDPVEFHDSGKLVDGQEQHGVFMGKSPEQKIVLFSSQETRNKFQANPQTYMATIRAALKQSSHKMR